MPQTPLMYSLMALYELDYYYYEQNLRLITAKIMSEGYELHLHDM